MLPLRDRMDMGTISMKMDSHFPKPPALQQTSPSECFSVIARTLMGGVYPSAEKQSVYSTAPTPANWAIYFPVKGVFQFSGY